MKRSNDSYGATYPDAPMVWQDPAQDGNNTHNLRLGPYAEVAQDESNGVKELRSLANWGIAAINDSTGRYEFSSGTSPNGVRYVSVSTQALDAEQEGTMYTPVGAGIRIDATDAWPEIVITQVKNEQAVYAQYTLETAGETIGTPGAELHEDGTPASYNPPGRGYRHHDQCGAVAGRTTCEKQRRQLPTRCAGFECGRQMLTNVFEDAKIAVWAEGKCRSSCRGPDM